MTQTPETILVVEDAEGVRKMVCSMLTQSGYNCLEASDGVEAVRWAKRLATRQPSRAQNHLLLGDAQALRGDAKAALRAWSKAARNGSASARARLPLRSWL